MLRQRLGSFQQAGGVDPAAEGEARSEFVESVPEPGEPVYGGAGLARRGVV
ncbi:hypothetical protein [Streptomyces yokosukanensis]|uniref:hypothetical protein n=1 Tax=Streptomyces yokosukanensis TaxID=67386 RepID=UPI00131A7ADB|nr:hypothetical protein [Streptomyces yokosukanensis]